MPSSYCALSEGFCSLDHVVPSWNSNNLIAEGIGLTTPKGYLRWFARSCLQIVTFFARQVPKQYKIKINTAAFLGAFSLEDEDGTRIQAEPWPLAPEVEPTEARKAAAQSWKDHHARHASFIPHTVATEYAAPGRKKGK